MIVGTAGHIDHGKTALVRALTQVDTDRLKEEKARGISIDLGFAYLPLSGDEKDILGFVDVPGHEKFVHTMLAGAASIDFVMLVVAADDGIMPQTREHLAIVNLLGIRRGVAVITKSDLAEPDRLAEVETAIRNELAPTGLADIPVLAVSTVSGAGIDDLRAMLEAQARAFGVRKANGRFRLAVDRSFTLKGAGTVVTGTVLSGKVAIGDHLAISPAGKEARVRTIHAQNRPSETAQAGDRCALNLAGEGISKEAVHRGDMLVSPALHRPTDRIDASLQILPSEKKPIGQWFPARLHHASAEVGARIVPLRSDELRPGAEDRVQLVLDRPLAVAAGDRFVIRDVSAQRTIGGGRFLDLRPPQRKRRSPERMAQLDAHSIDDPVQAARALLSVEPYYLDATAFQRDRALPDDPQALAQALDAVMLPQANSVLLLLPERWNALRDEIVARLGAFHAENPDLIGMGVERLRLLLKPRLRAPAFRAAIAALIEADLLRLDGAWLRLRDHEVTMSDADEALWQRIAPLLGGDARFRPPRVRDIAGLLDEREEDIRRLLKLAGRMGRVHEVAHDHFFLRATIAEMIGILSDMDVAFDSGWFIAARFRDRVDSGRKVAIQILEFFDRNSVTIRRGDMRRLNRRKLDLFGDFAQAETQQTGEAL
ncbi:selenocysteine-specific translation elongation factor [Brucella intermedia]|uniref:selenocysteine-specific translation elongation factor n=2 Tax=Brucella intermedia TaxID=94625 RepID=UPI000DE2E39C|nr:selenocysteine-specific translation elongation factor [Brucella intermedia]KAB2711288.1 selenocysteine-specific translation elongation factor [Brucella intermedia]MPR61576.1 selenocysteine-specific translation elongation factor [Brucella intermedia]NYD81499.1 selenocysteine-specific elongation factor [Brucella intermedia]